MLEQQLRDHFTQVADADLPPGTVSVAVARDHGLMLLKRRRIAIIGGPALAVIVVLALALTSMLLPAARQSQAPAGDRRVPAPAAFDPLYQTVSFGWLPLVQPIPVQGDVTSDYATATESSGSLVLFQVTAYAAGRCRMAGHLLSCAHSVARILGRAPDVDGRPAYWADSGPDLNTLAFQYAAGGWALLKDGHAPRASGVKAEAVKAARHVTVGAHLGPIRFPAQLTSVPPRWFISRTTFSIGPAGPVSRSFLIAGSSERVAAQLTISPLPDNACIIPASRYSLHHGVINGYRVTVIHFGPASTYVLCARRADGLSVMFYEPAWWHRRKPAAFLTGLFRHLTLLGASPARWTTQPLR